MSSILRRLVPGKRAKSTNVKHDYRLSRSFYLRYIVHDKSALLGVVILTFFFGWSIAEGILQGLAIMFNEPNLGWLILPSNPFAIHLQDRLLPPSFSQFPLNIFGTDNAGKSILSEVLYASPRDALIGGSVLASAIIVGLLTGLTAGYRGGWIDELLMRITDAFLSLPGLVLAIAIAVLLRGSFESLLIALSLVWWPTYARLFRSQALSLKTRGYVEYARLSGVRTIKILFRHLLPNSIDPVIAYGTLDFGGIILIYSGLAFLGIGVPPNYPELGEMASQGFNFFPSVWWYSIIPSVVIALVVVGASLVGDRFQDFLEGNVMT